VIENDRQLEYSIEQLARMYRLRDREVSETLWDPETREDVAEGTVSLIRKVEREIAEYLAKKYAIEVTPSEKAA
jgi:hypothetical protein